MGKSGFQHTKALMSGIGQDRTKLLTVFAMAFYLYCSIAFWQFTINEYFICHKLTRKPSYRWQTRATQKACQKLLLLDVLTTLSLTILAYLHSFSCCCIWNLRNPAKLTENSSLWSSRSSKVIDLGVNRKPVFEIFTLKAGKSLILLTPPVFNAP